MGNMKYLVPKNSSYHRTKLSPNTYVFPYQYYFTSALSSSSFTYVFVSLAVRYISTFK
jgi:hypothetical protein